MYGMDHTSRHKVQPRSTAWTTPVGRIPPGLPDGERGRGGALAFCVRCQHLFKEVRGRKAKATVPGAVRWRWLHVNKSSAFTRTVQGSVWEEGEDNSDGCSAVAVAVVTNFCVKFLENN